MSDLDSPALLEYRSARLTVEIAISTEYLRQSKSGQSLPPLVGIEFEELAYLDSIKITSKGEENLYFTWNGIACYCKCL